MIRIKLKGPSHWLFHSSSENIKCLHSPFIVYEPYFFISAPAISDTYSNNHNLVYQVLSELSVKFGEKQILVICKNSKHQKRGTPGTTFLDKPYSITKFSEVLIKEPDYVHFHYVGRRGEKEIEIEKQF